ncbi:MAG: hypothetical protein MJ082_03505 [Clostridia bacterium]|nr:hypothetical protein [Clostridia bacterium]
MKKTAKTEVFLAALALALCFVFTGIYLKRTHAAEYRETDAAVTFRLYEVEDGEVALLHPGQTFALAGYPATVTESVFGNTESGQTATLKLTCRGRAGEDGFLLGSHQPIAPGSILPLTECGISHVGVVLNIEKA